LVLLEMRQRELAAVAGIGDDSAAVDNGSAEA